ncbi:VOC family protein [Pseudomonas sp. R5(2019)]|uniref:VOC family protein n=1 Tax=Pseudomonas sp. R5(2019) TaxID=2697566 RepID=UPI001412819C|nr:VOC family protein [Pseudomonas sp. R5(2019)]NBA96557.1 VOC family protein [Pseudomonas sp. R5(2019)]
MTAKVGRVDHPVVAVNDLKTTRAQYQKLGFVVPPSGKHQEWGTENLCIMFADDYLEIRGIGDPEKFLAGVDKFLAKGEGLYSVAFNAKSADESYKAGIESALGIEPPKHLNRKLVLEDKVLDLHFRTVMLDHSLFPGLTHANLCEHLTADTLRQPGWLDHPNGVQAFGRLVGVVSDFDAAEDAYNSLLGAENVRRETDRIWLNFGEGADVELITPVEAEQRGDANPARGDAYLASATLLVKNIDETAKVFSANGIRFEPVADGTLRVDPADACGAHLYFKQD